MKKKIIYGLLFAVAMVTASSSFVSCKDYEGDDYAHWQEGLAANGFNDRSSLREIIAFQIKTLRYELTNALGNSDYVVNNGDTVYIYNDAQIQQWLKDLDAIENGYSEDSSISELIKTLNDLNKLASSASIVNESLKGIRYAWSDSLKAAFDTASMAYHKADSALALAIRDSMRNDTLSNRIDTLTKRADSLFQRANELADSAMKKADSILNKRLNDRIDSLIAAKDTTDSVNNLRLDSIYNWLNALTPEDSLEYEYIDENGDTVKVKKAADNIGDIIEAFNKTDEFLQYQINDLYSLVDRLQKDLEKLQKDLDNLFGALKKQITGIIVQGTYSPVFGYGSLPLGVQTNILSAYVGNVQIAGGKFPSFNSGNYADEKKGCIFTEGDIKYLSGVATEAVPEGLLMNEEQGNAGYMYLTVNPTNIDFEGTDFFLVNSKGEESRMKLSKLEASDDELTFGWTRGTSVGKESANGLYKVVATIDKGDAKFMQPKFDKAGFKKAVQAATEGQKRMAVKEVAKALYNSLQPTQRFGVKAEWVDTVTTKDKTAKRSVTSAYDIAALSIEPLGFGFKSLDGVIKLPTINEKIIAEDMHINLTIDNIQVKPKDGKYIVTTDIHLVDFNPNLIEYDEVNKKYVFVGKTGTYTIVNVGGKDVSLLDKDQLVNLFRQGEVVKIDVTDFVTEIYGEFNKELEKIDFSGSTANINSQIDKIAKTVNSYIDRANSWINRFNNLFAHLSNALQPVLLWSDGESSGELGGVVSANYVVGKPVKAGTKLCLIPTTYSLELFAPAYKKSLLVTNAYDLKTGDSAQKGNANLKAAADALSAQLKKYASYKSTPSLNKDNMIEINVGSKTGVTYEIAYTALDYEGKVAGRKFYITVVE